MGTTSTGNITRDALIRRALRKLGNSDPSSEEIANGVESLMAIVKEIDVSGKWLWAVDHAERTLTISAATQSYTTGIAAGNIRADMLELVNFELYQGSQHLPCRIVTEAESLTALSRDTTGQPYEIYLERKPLLADNVLWVRPSPSGSFTAKYTYRRRLYDFTAASDNPDFPQEWIQTLTYKLADDLADEYGTPLERCQWIQARAHALLKKMVAANSGNTADAPTEAEYF